MKNHSEAGVTCQGKEIKTLLCDTTINIIYKILHSNPKLFKVVEDSAFSSNFPGNYVDLEAPEKLDDTVIVTLYRR